jgi:hypothetical protein
MADGECHISEICYSQNFEQARSLNQQMNQVPILAMTLTGGLWFGAGVTESLDTRVRFLLLLFAGACNLALALVILRIRDVLESYFEKIEEFHPQSFAGGMPTKHKPKLAWLGRYSMITIYCALMLIAALASVYGAFFIYWPFEISAFWGVGALLLALIVLWVLLFNRAGNQHHGQT